MFSSNALLLSSLMNCPCWRPSIVTLPGQLEAEGDSGLSHPQSNARGISVVTQLYLPCRFVFFSSPRYICCARRQWRCVFGQCCWVLLLLTQASSGGAQPLYPQLKLKQHLFRFAIVTKTGEKISRVRLWGYLAVKGYHNCLL